MACETCTPNPIFTTPIKVPGVPVNRKWRPLIRVNGKVEELPAGVKFGMEYLDVDFPPPPEIPEIPPPNRDTSLFTVGGADLNVWTIGDMALTTIFLVDNNAPSNVVLPLDATYMYPNGTEVQIVQFTVNAVTVTAESGVTLYTPNGAATTGQGDMRIALKIGPDKWTVV